MPHLEVVELVLIHFNLVNNNYQQNSRIYIHLHQTCPLEVYYNYHPQKMSFLKKFNSDFQEIKVWFTDQNFKPLQVEEKINLTLIIK